MIFQLISVGLMPLNLERVIIQWNKIDIKIQKSPYSVSRINLLKKIKLQTNTIYSIYNPSGIKLLTRLRLGFSHLNECRLNHSVDDCVNLFCTCSLEPVSVLHFLLHCHHCNSIQWILFIDDLKNLVDKNF